MHMNYLLLVRFRGLISMVDVIEFIQNVCLFSLNYFLKILFYLGTSKYGPG